MLSIYILTSIHAAMDDIDRKIFELLSADARRSLADIGSSVDLSPSAVNERIRRLTSSGALRRFTVDIDPDAFGFQTLLFVLVALREDAEEGKFRTYAASHKGVLECHHVTGPWSYLMKVRVEATPDIEIFLADMKNQGGVARTETIISLSSPEPGAFILKDQT